VGEFSIWHWLVVAILLIGMYVPFIFYILSLQRALESIDQTLRPVSPGLAWLLLIPLFNFIWIFFLVVWISKGYEKMWELQRLKAQSSAGFGVGIAYSVCWVLCLIPGLNLLVLIPSLVLWILHWVQVSQARKLVLQEST
jgi:hypothetical protein